MSNEQFFTDVVKDVIGNDPVVDQFDTYYEASFYGTMQDDYITGSMLAITDVKNKKFAVSDGSLGTRGRAFSIYYAESQPPLESTYGSAGVTLNPFLSKRVVPWKERSSSTSYRLRQLFDGSERYYDSCIPDVAYSLGVDGSRIWTNNDATSDARTRTTLAPYASVITGSTVGYMLFNAVEQDRSAEGYDGDPTTNNDWTWSFPYESKYRPTNRLVRFDSNLSLKSDLSARLPLYDKKEREFIGAGVRTYAPESNGYYYLNSNDAIADTTPVEITETKLRNVEFFLPLLPGYYDHDPSQFRNSFRTKVTITGSLGDGRIRTAWYKSSLADTNFGHALVIPSDVNLSSRTDNKFLDAYPNADPSRIMPVTQSMSTDDKIKFLFGFGDVNAVTYGKRSYDSSKANLSYELDLDDYAEGTKPHQFSAYDQDGLAINWNFTSSDSNYQNYWYVATQTNANPYYVSADNRSYDWISGSGPGGNGIGWEHVSGSSTKVLVSNTDTSYHGSMSDSGDAVSPFWLDITSSYPWNFSYDRAIGQYGVNAQTMKVYFAAYPGQPSDWLTKVYQAVYIPGTPEQISPSVDFVTSSIAFVTMSNYNFQRDFFNTKNFTGVMSSTHIEKQLGQYLLEPGEYRLVFQFNFTDPPVVTPLCAAIRNFKIFTFKEEAFPVIENSRIGGNNYPRFKTYRIDNRVNPTLSGTVSILQTKSISENSYKPIPVSDYIVSGSVDASKSIIFGISPEIRGWKYGLVSGFPTHSKAVFRRDKYGQFRDMLEQRPYTKFINALSSPLDNDAITIGSFNVQTDSRAEAYAEGFTDIGPSVVAVNFVKQRYRKNDKGVGYIYNEKVDPLQTYSQNLSGEVTSSLPYFDGVARHRQDQDLQLVSDAGLSSLQINSSGVTVV